MATKNFPFGPILDDAGALVAGATVAIASVKDMAGSNIASHGATLSDDGTGLRVSVAYDPLTKGEAWITLSVSKAGSTITGINASPTIFAAADANVLDAITAKTTNLPPDPADASDIAALFAAIPGAVWAAGTRTLTAISDSSGITTLLARLTNTRATLLDNLAFLTAAPPSTGQIAAAVSGAAVVLSGPSTITTVDSGEDGTVGLFVGDRYSLVLQAKVGGSPMAGTGATWKVSTTNESTGTAVSTDIDPDLLAEEMGLLTYPLQAADTTSAARLRLTVKRTQGSDVRIFGPLILNVRDR